MAGPARCRCSELLTDPPFAIPCYERRSTATICHAMEYILDHSSHLYDFWLWYTIAIPAISLLGRLHHAHFGRQSQTFTRSSRIQTVHNGRISSDAPCGPHRLEMQSSRIYCGRKTRSTRHRNILPVPPPATDTASQARASRSLQTAAFQQWLSSSKPWLCSISSLHAPWLPTCRLASRNERSL